MYSDGFQAVSGSSTIKMKLVSFSHHRIAIYLNKPFFFANPEKVDSRQTGSGPQIVLTPVEELLININSGRPGMEGVPGGTSSESLCLPSK